MIKKMSAKQIALAIRSMNGTELPLKMLEMLVRYLPTAEEVEAIQNFDGDPDHLAECESFFYEFREQPRVLERVKCWVFKLRFEGELYDDENSRLEKLEACVKCIS